MEASAMLSNAHRLGRRLHDLARIRRRDDLAVVYLSLPHDLRIAPCSVSDSCKPEVDYREGLTDSITGGKVWNGTTNCRETKPGRARTCLK